MKKIMALFLVLATVLSLMTVGAYAAADNALSVSCKLYDGYTVVTVQKSGTGKTRRSPHHRLRRGSP